MMSEVDRVLAELYPTRTWGEARDGEAGMDLEDLSALAEELAQELTAATFVRLGDDAEPCDYIYVLCLGRAPCIAQVRDHGVAPPDEWATAERIDEQYLRVVIAHRARVAAVQQVAMTMERTPDGMVIREAPRAGVYDAPLLHRMQKLVAVLPAYDLLHVDFGEIAHAPEGFHAGAWEQLYAGKPAIANYLFFPQPATMLSTTMVSP
jgi:hypothetical protein